MENSILNEITQVISQNKDRQGWIPLSKLALICHKKGVKWAECGKEKFIDFILDHPETFRCYELDKTQKFISLVNADYPVKENPVYSVLAGGEHKELKLLRIAPDVLAMFSNMLNDKILSSDDKLLESYMFYTFCRLQAEKKLLIRDSEILLNTGLTTSSYEPIYALGRIDSGEVTVFKFLNGESKDALRRVKIFRGAPIAASYVDPRQASYNADLHIRVNYEHVISERKSRFPSSIWTFLNRGGEIIDNQDYDNFLRRLVDGAVLETERRLRFQPEAAIKCWYRRTNAICWLLPLKLGIADEATSALVVEYSVLNGEEYYQAHTILTLADAYKSARVVQPVNSDWLRYSPQGSQSDFDSENCDEG